MDNTAIPRRFSRSFLLLALRQRHRGPGYELFETIEGLGVQIDLAGVYRELRSMEQHELLSSSWLPSDAGPDRRVYELTDAGRAAAASALTELTAARDQLTAGLAAVSQPVS
jgi:PadR family transcriptional regulator PadR